MAHVTAVTAADAGDALWPGPRAAGLDDDLALAERIHLRGLAVLVGVDVAVLLAGVGVALGR